MRRRYDITERIDAINFVRMETDELMLLLVDDNFNQESIDFLMKFKLKDVIEVHGKDWTIDIVRKAIGNLRIDKYGVELYGR